MELQLPDLWQSQAQKFLYDSQRHDNFEVSYKINR